MLEYLSSYEVHHWVMMIAWSMVLLVIIYVIDYKKENKAQVILNNRLAKGEITLEEFKALKKEI